MNSKSVLGVLGTAAATVVLVAGCSGASDTATGTSTTPSAAATSSAATSAAHNAADTAFVQGMIPHHTQAVQMSEMAAQRASNEQVKQLATRIQQAQGPEIEQMRGFLAAWGEPETGSAGPSGSLGGMDHGSMNGSTSMPMSQGTGGMMTDQQMQRLGQADGTAFDRMFLQMMTEHHNGAIQMARTELAQGQNPDAKALAQKIIDDQQAEITEMQQLLATL
ncbi:DUF305 domain-containing protein [Pseudonocardia halophobica]|uniref:DUF305 domain-containing protein n=1 Tax=Pseudonocardia halophobica TaxID=29401 RepID=A0A9W6L1K2_9PSEU|nr:DUF305 domain-containing protein [Pseudonocardia halophobica]GLL11212.1 hypothetical protein GCM10017577_23530 [Pseudonocardia halophobica]